MKASDYIVEYLIEKGVSDVFGYPGGMVTHLMDSFGRYHDKISAHVTYHEQGAALAACGYAQVSGKCGVAYATSGPGATNLITGICNAYMDSIPTVFITGQVNSYEQKGDLRVRQRGFQETDIVSVVRPITKYAVQVNDASQIRYYLDKAFYMAEEGRKGPVLLDIAMDVTRAEVNREELRGFPVPKEYETMCETERILPFLATAKRPVLLLGNGVARDKNSDRTWKDKINEIGVPVVTSMISVDVQEGLQNCYGFVGAYGSRVANFVVAKSDLVIALGARLDIRQVGAIRNRFAPDARIVRVDIDSNELEYKVREDEIAICADASRMLSEIASVWPKVDYSVWTDVCDRIKSELLTYDDRKYNKLVRRLSHVIPEDAVITTDVGQNQVWVAQSFELKKGQRILFSGGHGTMGYSLPASMGAALASGKVVYSFNGDGGIQMNIQELQMIVREKLPVKILLFNNGGLGMIRHFQEMYFDGKYYQTVPEGGFTSPDFSKVADAYGLAYRCVQDESDIDSLSDILSDDLPAMVEVKLCEKTHVFPKLEYGKPNQDQEPLLDRTLYDTLMNL